VAFSVGLKNGEVSSESSLVVIVIYVMENKRTKLQREMFLEFVTIIDKLMYLGFRHFFLSLSCFRLFKLWRV
jgi:ABC-type iron transport system FetAB permease component